MYIWYFLLGVALFGLLRKIVLFLVHLFRKKKTVYNSQAQKQVQMLIDFATITTKHIQNELGFESLLLFYEQVFFLYFMADIKNIGNKMSKKYRDAVLKAVIEALKAKYNLLQIDNVNQVKNIFSKRYQYYITLFVADDYKMSNNFFNNIFEYQAILIEYIQKENKLSDKNPLSIPATRPVYQAKVKVALAENLETILAFYNQ